MDRLDICLGTWLLSGAHRRIQTMGQRAFIEKEGIAERLDRCARVDDLLTCHALERPDGVAIQVGQSSVTYRDLLDRSKRMAVQLASEGLRRGDRIALLSKNDVAFIDLMMAASMTGIVLVPLNFRLAQPEIDFIIEDSGAQLLFTGPEFAKTARTALANCDACRAVVEITGDGLYSGWLKSSERQSVCTDGGDTTLFQM
jgi:acyl-CoA synthetase (AMP-forming)/AMP-acid ligase II